MSDHRRPSLIIHQASRLAAKHHHGQFRKHSEGIPYIVHPARVAARLAHEHAPQVVQAAGWCHDLLEDTACTHEELLDISSELLWLVQQLTNPSKGEHHLSRPERKAMDRQHLRGVSQVAQTIKIYDRMDNLHDARDTAPVEWLRMYCEESLLLAGALVDHPQAPLLERLCQAILNDLPHQETKP